MQDLEITWPGGASRFTVADSPVRLGRSSEAAVPLTEGSVSRRHLELTWDGQAWIASDSSTHGTFDTAGERLAPQWLVSSDATLRLGGVEGVEVHLRPLPADHGSPAPVPAGGAGDPTAIDGDPLPAPSPPAILSDLAPVGHDAANGAAGPGPIEVAPGSDQGETADPRRAPLFPASAERHGPASSAAPAGLFAGRDATAHQGTVDRSAPPARPSVRLESGPPGPTGPPPVDGARGEQPTFLSPGPTGGHPAVNLNPNSTIISDSTLRLNVGGQDYSFLPGAEVTVGRDPSCLVRLDERHSLVSRHHLRITFDNDAWWLEDFSSKGTYIDSKRLKKPYKAEGAFIANLGDDDAGTPMRVITAGEHRAPRNNNAVVIAALAAAALLPLLILAFLLTRGGGPNGEPDFETAKRSTVMLFGLDGGQGSGFLVADDLILTNQHVAVLSPQMLVGVSRQADQPAQIEYATELVANHPFLDLAVLRISNRAAMTADGPVISADPVGDIDLPAVAIGDSSEVTLGDRVFNTGFPGRLSITSTDDAGDLRLPAVVATSGEAANFAIWPGCSNPDFELYIPSDSPPGVACSAGGDLENGVLLSSFFSSGQGSSGSAVYHENKVVAVVYAGAAEEDNATLSITSAVFADWLQEIIDQNS